MSELETPTHPVAERLTKLLFLWGVASLALAALARWTGYQDHFLFYPLAVATVAGAAALGVAYLLDSGTRQIKQPGAGVSGSFNFNLYRRDRRALLLLFGCIIYTWYLSPRGQSASADFLVFATFGAGLMIAWLWPADSARAEPKK